MGISRRAFIVASGCATGQAAVPARQVNFRGAHLPREVQLEMSTRTACDIGCDPTGKIDCVKQIEDHLESHGRLYIDRGIFRLSRPIFLKSNQRIFGSGPESILWNDRSHENIAYHCVFMIGNHFSSALTASSSDGERYVSYGASFIRAGQSRIDLENRLDVDQFDVGELVFVSSSTYYTLGANSVYEYLKLTEIVGKSDGGLLIKDPVDEDLEPGALVWKIGGVDPLFKREFYAVKNVEIHDLGIDAYSFAQRWSFYESYIWNLRLFNCVNGIVGNAATKSRIANISGEFSSRAIEIKTGANALVVENVLLRYKRDERVQAQVFVQTGEQAYNIHLENVKIVCSEPPNSSVRAMELLGRNISFVHGYVARAGAIREACVAVLSPNARQRWSTKNVQIIGSTFECGSVPTNYLKIGHSGDSSEPDDIAVVGNVWRGSPTSQSVWIDGGSLKFFNNRLHDPIAGMVEDRSTMYSDLLRSIKIFPGGQYHAVVPTTCRSIIVFTGLGGRKDPKTIFLDGAVVPFAAMDEGVYLAINDLVLTVRNHSESKIVLLEAELQ